MKLIWQCLFSPRLYKVYKDGPGDAWYQPHGMEKWGDKVITTANTLLNIGLYTSPFICLYIYRRGFISFEDTKTLGRFIGTIGSLLVFSFLLRAYGRATSPKYLEFMKALNRKASDKKEYIKGIRKFDFEFQSWPSTFSVASKKSSSWLECNPFSTSANYDLPLYQRITIQTLAFIATHTFGLRLIYPGSLALVQTMLWDPLFQGRTHLVENLDGQRAKLLTADGNAVDTMFVDNSEQSLKGKTLVICCEGNSGFYEIGIMTTPVKAGFSALGWNHPGFAGSTGYPYPTQEKNAMDAVMQYAIFELGFQPENIVLFGWSIGGYCATWAAANYPVQGLVLDATFDDLLPLAQNQMPSSWSLLVKEVVRSYVDLDIAGLLSKYDGPVQLIRRTEDEIICLRQGQLSSNRGNHLVSRLIEQRHGSTVQGATEKRSLMKLASLLESQRRNIHESDLEQHERPLMPLVSKYMRDYKSSHCTPLPEEHFNAAMSAIIAENKLKLIPGNGSPIPTNSNLIETKDN